MKEKRFIVTENSDSFSTRLRVIVDTKTGVQYLYAGMGYGGGVTVLVDENGKPIIAKEYKTK